jgi:hypothetical protein
MAARTRSRFDDAPARPRSDAYTGMLALSLIAMIASCVILYLDYAQYGATKAPAVAVPKATRPAPINQGAPAEKTAAAPVPPDIIPVAATAPAAPEPAPPVAAVGEPPALPPNVDGPALPPAN